MEVNDVMSGLEKKVFEIIKVEAKPIRFNSILMRIEKTEDCVKGDTGFRKVDRALQKLRRKGLISFTSKGWVIGGLMIW